MYLIGMRLRSFRQAAAILQLSTPVCTHRWYRFGIFAVPASSPAVIQVHVERRKYSAAGLALPGGEYLQLALLLMSADPLGVAECRADVAWSLATIRIAAIEALAASWTISAGRWLHRIGCVEYEPS